METEKNYREDFKMDHSPRIDSVSIIRAFVPLVGIRLGTVSVLQ